jgi:hypothetical protein
MENVMDTPVRPSRPPWPFWLTSLTLDDVVIALEDPALPVEAAAVLLRFKARLEELGEACSFEGLGARFTAPTEAVNEH